MKLLFSEAQADYDHYIFPYAIWGFPENGETPADLFAQGFLPGSRELDRFYLCRNIRIRLALYQASSENRRVLRKGEGIAARLIQRAEFEYSAARREFYKSYADARFGKDIMSYARLDSLFSSRLTSHVLLFTETQSGAEVGAATLYLEPPTLAYYYYAFYDLKYFRSNLGMFMMTSAVQMFVQRGLTYLYLGSCYSRNALYKTQFTGAEFFNGVRWSDNLNELKYLVGREDNTRHLLENEDYRRTFYAEELGALAVASHFRSVPSEQA